MTKNGLQPPLALIPPYPVEETIELRSRAA
jgi:hypothetical protein